METPTATALELITCKEEEPSSDDDNKQGVNKFRRLNHIKLEDMEAVAVSHAEVKQRKQHPWNVSEAASYACLAHPNILAHPHVNTYIDREFAAMFGCIRVSV